MNIDTIKGVAAIAISVGVMIGGLLILYFTKNPSTTSVEQPQQQIMRVRVYRNPVDLSRDLMRQSLNSPWPPQNTK